MEYSSGLSIQKGQEWTYKTIGTILQKSGACATREQ